MIRHIFLDKTNTIVNGLHVNTGLNPVCELNYGPNITRFLIHFDDSRIKEMYEEKDFNLSKTKFILKMTNTAGVNGVPYEKPVMFGNTSIIKERASSFTVLAMRLPCGFDTGRGFEYLDDMWIGPNKSFSTDGCNWFQCYNGKAWPEEGVYSPLTIKEEYDKFFSEDEEERRNSLVIDRQHFDFGDENLCIDLTKYVNEIIEGKENTGILLCFSPLFEVLNGGCEFKEIKHYDGDESELKVYSQEMPSTCDITVPEYFIYIEPVSYIKKYYRKIIKDVQQQYVGFFTDHTNTFFHPYLEIQYNEYIRDDREAFYNGKENKLYLYSNIAQKPENLDVLPVCSFGDTICEVEQVTKGVYCAKVLANDYEDDSIVYDTWSNLKYKGVDLDDVELETVVLSKNGYFNIGSGQPKADNIVPSVYGINDDECVKKGDIREVVVDFRKKYTTNERLTATDAHYRLYVLDGEREIDIFNGYQPIERTFLHNYFMLYTEDLIPNKKYYVDIKVKTGREEKFFKNVLHFKIADDVTERYV